MKVVGCSLMRLNCVYVYGEERLMINYISLLSSSILYAQPLFYLLTVEITISMSLFIGK